VLSHSPLARSNSGAAGEGRAEATSVLLILLLANGPHEDAAGDVRESLVSPAVQPCCGCELGSRGRRAAGAGLGRAGCWAGRSGMLSWEEWDAELGGAGC